jgi:hypothetical protein
VYRITGVGAAVKDLEWQRLQRMVRAGGPAQSSVGGAAR